MFLEFDQRWKLPHFNPHLTYANQLYAVHFKCRNGCSANGCQAYDLGKGFIPNKVLYPFLVLGIK